MNYKNKESIIQDFYELECEIKELAFRGIPIPYELFDNRSIMLHNYDFLLDFYTMYCSDTQMKNITEDHDINFSPVHTVMKDGDITTIKHLVKNKSLKDYDSFNADELINMLPEMIGDYVLYIYRINNYWVVEYCEDKDISNTNHILSICKSPSLVGAAYDMLIWVLDNVEEDKYKLKF